MHTIRGRIISVLIMVVLIPIIALGGITYAMSKGIIEDELKEYNEKMLKEANELYLEQYLEQLEEDIVRLEESLDIDRLFSDENYKEDISKEWDSYRDNNPHVSYVYLGTKENQFWCSPVYIPSADYRCVDRPWYITGLGAKDEPKWTEAYVDVDTGSLTVSVVKGISNGQGDVESVLTVDVTLNSLANIVELVDFGKNETVFITNNEGSILAHSDDKKISENFSEKPWMKEVLEEKDGVYLEEIEEASYYVCHTTVDNTGWKFVALIPREQLDEKVAPIRNITIIIGIISTIIAVILGVIMIERRIAKPINKLQKISEKIAEGDFTEAIDPKLMIRKDEIGQLSKMIQKIIDNLQTMIKQITVDAQNVMETSVVMKDMSKQSSEAANDISRTVEEIAHGASEQASSTEQVVINVSELSELIENDQSNLNHLNQATKQVVTLQEEGISELEVLMRKSELNQKAAEDINEVVVKVSESAEKIQQASQMISSIADQTNLLALNAAIEAARAGEAGKGFAVVADEIRLLADQSDQFTGEIAEIISELKNKTDKAVVTIKEMNAIVDDQSIGVKNTKNQFEGISDAIGKMKNTIESLSESGKLMENKKDNISDIIQNLSAISEENAAGTEETSASVEEQTAAMEQIASASEDLMELAEKMNESVSEFKY